MRLLIIDDDAEFRRRFSGYIASGCEDISITVCGGESAEAELARGTDYIICDENAASGITGAVSASGIACTVLAGREEYTGADRNVRKVFKFQGADAIIHSIPEIYALIAAAEYLPGKQGEMTVICVSGMTGGCGKTAFSITLARILQQKTGRGSLIIGIDQMSDIYDYFIEGGAAGREDINLLLLNYASGGRIDPTLYLLSDSYGVSCLRPPADCESDLSTLTADELLGFIEYINGWNIFGTLIFDMSGILDERSSCLYANADLICLMHDDRRHPFGTEEVWRRRVMEKAAGRPVRRILNFDISGGAVSRIFYDEDMVRTEKVYDYSLPADPDSFFIKNGCACISMSGAYAAAVDAVCKGVWR